MRKNIVAGNWKMLSLIHISLGEFLKINLDIRVEQVVFDLPRCLQRISK